MRCDTTPGYFPDGPKPMVALKVTNGSTDTHTYRTRTYYASCGNLGYFDCMRFHAMGGLDWVHKAREAHGQGDMAVHEVPEIAKCRLREPVTRDIQYLRQLYHITIGQWPLNGEGDSF